MDQDRYERLEARLSALESAVGRISGDAARAKTAPPVAAPTVAVVHDVVAVVLAAALPPVLPPAPRAPGSLERAVAGRGLQFAGLTLVLLGVAFFLDMAFTRGWIGPAERILLGLAAGAALIAFAARGISEVYRLLAESLIALGAGILYLSLWASIARFPELGVSHGAAFAAMIAVTALLGALAATRRSERIALLGSIGGFITPVLLAGGPPDRIVLAVYVLVLSAGMLVLTARYAFVALDVVTFVGVLAYAGAFAPDSAAGWTVVSAQIVATCFFLTFAIGVSVGARSQSSSRRLILLVLDAGCYAAVLELLFGDRTNVLGIDLLAFAALLLMAAQVPKLERALARAYGYLGLGAVTLALAALLHGSTLTDAFAIEGTLLLVLATRGSDKRLAIGGGVLMFFTGLILCGRAVVDPPGEALGLAAGFAIWLAGAGYALYLQRGAGDPNSQALRALARFGFDVVAVFALSRACLDLLGGPAWDSAIPSRAQFGLSIVWTACATGLFGYGLRRRLPAMRWEALALFGLTILKVFSVDLSSVDLEYRVGSFVVLGAVLFGVSAWYTRSMAKDAKAAE
jgi:uncharacterized membrane protein